MCLNVFNGEADGSQWYKFVPDISDHVMRKLFHKLSVI